MNQQTNKPIIVWLLTGCFLVFVMVIIGGITRLTHSGLSMVEWHLIMGSIPPLNEAEWQEMFEKYKQFPEFKELNYHFTLKEFKSIFFWEYLHRLLGRLIGIVFIVPFIWFLAKKMLTRELILKCLILFGLGALQGLLGWYMVKSGLIKEPRVSHLRLAAHLIMAFFTFSYTFWVALDLIYKEGKTTDLPQVRKMGNILFVFVVVQIVYGAFVAGLRAGTVYNTFPKMGDSWIAEGVTAMSPWYENFINGLAGVQFAHRYMAYIILVLIIIIWWKAIKKPLVNSQQLAVRGILYIVILQFLLGVFTLLNAVPVTLGVLHQAGAFLLLAANVFLIHRFKPTAQ